MKYTTIAAIALLAASCQNKPGTTPPVGEGQKAPVEREMVLEFEDLGQLGVTCDTFYANGLIAHRYTRGPESEMSGYIHRAWNGKSYRYIDTENTDSVVYVYYQDVSQDSLASRYKGQ